MKPSSGSQEDASITIHLLQLGRDRRGIISAPQAPAPRARYHPAIDRISPQAADNHGDIKYLVPDPRTAGTTERDP
jgi:hypothetical protein